MGLKVSVTCGSIIGHLGLQVLFIMSAALGLEQRDRFDMYSCHVRAGNTETGTDERWLMLSSGISSFRREG